MDNIKSYIASLIPEGIAERKKQELRDELESHILDRVDFYVDIGYAYEQSVQKALEDMGKGEEIRKSVRDEFEQIYHERTFWAVLSGAVIVAMNVICFSLWSFVGIVEPGNTEPPNCVMSFIMMFVTFAMIFFAKKMGYQKMLKTIGLVHILLFPFAFYPQCAMVAVYKTFLFLLDRFTQYSGRGELESFTPNFAIVTAVLLFVFIGGYCLVSAARFEKSKTNTKKRAIALSVMYALLSVFFVVMSAVCDNYFSNYPHYMVYTPEVTAMSESVFESIEDITDYEKAKALIENAGYVGINDYKNSLDKRIKRQFEHNILTSDITLSEDEEGFFVPLANGESDIGMLWLRHDESGNLTAYGVGDVMHLYDRGKQVRHRYLCENERGNPNISESIETYMALEKGANADVVVLAFKIIGCEVYCDIVERTENGRVRKVGICGMDENYDYFEGTFTFLNGELISCEGESSQAVLPNIE